MVCTVQLGPSDMDDTNVLLCGHAVYRENFQGQGQERCCPDQQQLCRTAAVPEKRAEFPWYSLILLECPKLKQSRGAGVFMSRTQVWSGAALTG